MLKFIAWPAASPPSHRPSAQVARHSLPSVLPLHRCCSHTFLIVRPLSMYHSEFGRRLRTQSGGSSSLARPSGGSAAHARLPSPRPPSAGPVGTSLASSSRSSRPMSFSGASVGSEAGDQDPPSLGPSHSAASLANRRRRRSSQMSGGLRHVASAESLHSSPSRSVSRSLGAGPPPVSPPRSSAAGLSASIGSAQSSHSARRRTVFVDRFIPTRHGDDLHDAYHLLDEHPASPSKGKKVSPVDTDAQKGSCAIVSVDVEANMLRLQRRPRMPFPQF